MKRILLTFLTIFFALLSFSQTFPTTFMGIPVDGSKVDMVSALEAKGFNENLYTGELEGQFNGILVKLRVHTNKDKVDRIIVTNKDPYNVSEAKIQFNNLCKEFENTKRYFNALGHDHSYIIPEGEDIDYNIIVHKKRYEASYFQAIDINDTNNVKKLAQIIVASSNYEDRMKMNEEEKANYYSNAVTDLMVKVIPNRSVWFFIKKKYNHYYIVLYYDNEYNRPHGEDL